MRTLHPLDIPELRQSIVHYLDFKSICACSTVCREWHDEIQPLIWKEYRLNPSRLLTHGQEAWVAAMSNNAHLIRYFNQCRGQDDSPVPEVVYDTLLKYCRGLVLINGKARNIDEWARLKELILVNTTLQYLILELDQWVFDDSPYTMFTQPAADGSQGHSQLCYLNLKYMISAETLKRILLACPALEDATVSIISETTTKTESYDNTSNSNSSSINHGQELCEHQTPTSLPPLSSKLRRLYIAQYCDDPALGDLLECIPSLISLEMPDIDFLVSQRLRQTFERGFLKQLKTIHLSQVFDEEEYEEEMLPLRAVLQVLRAIPHHQLQDVTLKSIGLIETTFLVDHQHRSLQSVTLFSAPPEALVALLTGCSHLKELRVSSYFPVDVSELLNQPWACTSSLEILSAMFCLPAATEGTDTAVIENEFMMKLGQCTRLRELTTSNYRHGKSVHLRWTLAHGLYHLASLSRLETIRFGSWMSFEVSELQFMKEHWPRVKCLPELKPISTTTLTWLQENWPSVYGSMGDKTKLWGE